MVKNRRNALKIEDRGDRKRRKDKGEIKIEAVREWETEKDRETYANKSPRQSDTMER